MNTCTARAWNKPLFAALLLPLALTGCKQDSASYAIDGDRQHAILLIRTQAWFWDNKVKLTIAPARLPDCQSSLTVDGVPRSGDIALYQAPDEYAEPLYILKTGDRLFAVSTASCRVQPFETAPDPLGVALGTFREQEGKFAFEPAKAGAATS